MNLRAINSSIFKTFQSLERPNIIECKENIAYCPNGFVGFIIPDQSMIFDKSKFKLIVSDLKFYKTNDDIHIIETNRAILNKGRILKKFKSKEFNVYINQKFLSFFDNPKLFSFGKDKRVLVYEQDVLCGIIMPVVLSDKVLNDELYMH